MDEIFDRIKAAKINPKYLAAALIFTELLGIITLIWYLKAPLYQKYLLTPPKAYLITQMNGQIRYKIAQNDYITGYTSTDNKVGLLIREGKDITQKAIIKPNIHGEWTYQIPDNLLPGVKTLIVADIGTDKIVSNIRNYHIRIIPNEIINLKNNLSGTILEDTISITKDISGINTDPSVPVLNSVPDTNKILYQPPISE